jgi:hypothetical protein
MARGLIALRTQALKALSSCICLWQERQID